MLFKIWWMYIYSRLINTYKCFFLPFSVYSSDIEKLMSQKSVQFFFLTPKTHILFTVFIQSVNKVKAHNSFMKNRDGKARD